MLHFIPPASSRREALPQQHMSGMSAPRPSFKSVNAAGAAAGAASISSSSQSQSTKISSFFNEVFRKYDSGTDSSGILSPACGSTSVTPITPITPLTTPRTPLQILLGRNNNGVGGPFRRTSITRYHNSSCCSNNSGATAAATSLSDEYYDDDDQYREKQRLALQLIANFLNTAESTLNDITERESLGQQVLGPGIVRVCHDLADEVEGVANELRKEHTRAAQHLAHAMSDHELNLIEEGDATNNNRNGGVEKEVNNIISEGGAITANNNDNALAQHSTTLTSSESVASFQSQEEFISTLSTTHTLLLDTAAALRAITQQEAQELGEVALDVARMFLWSLGKVHSNMIQMTMSNEYYPHPASSSTTTPLQPPILVVPHHEKEMQGQIIGVGVALPKKSTLAAGLSANTTPKQNRVTWYNENTKSHNGPVIEILGEEEKKEGSPQKIPTTTEFRYSPQLSPIPSSPGASSPINSISSSKISTGGLGGGHSCERVRILWPPLLPAMTEVGKSCAIHAKEHPLPAIAIGLTCGPVAILTAALAGPPLLVTDWAIQTSYDALSEHTPVIENVEKGAASALQVARLAILCSKLVIKQGLTVGERQIERRGGAGKICSDVVSGALDMATHPVETACTAWDGLFWMGGAVRDAVVFVKDTVSGGDVQMDMH